MKIMMTILLLLFTTIISFAPTNKHCHKVQDMRNMEFSEYNLKSYLIEKNVKHLDIVYKQAILETGTFSSNIFKKYNNLFGMHFPSIRETTASGYVIADNNSKVACYKHWTESVDDYLLWQKYNEKHLNNCYYTFLQKIGYAENKNYIKILKSL